MIIIVFAILLIYELLLQFVCRLMEYNSYSKIKYLCLIIIITILSGIIYAEKNGLKYISSDSFLIIIFWLILSLGEIIYKGFKNKDKKSFLLALNGSECINFSFDNLKDYTENELQIIKEISMQLKDKKKINILYIGKKKDTNTIKLIFLVRNFKSSNVTSEICEKYGEIEYCKKNAKKMALLCNIECNNNGVIRKD